MKTFLKVLAYIVFVLIDVVLTVASAITNETLSMLTIPLNIALLFIVYRCLFK